MSNHNNIPSTIGNFYHYLIVINKLFYLKENQKIIIEVNGDITIAKIDNSTFLENYEIKYHQDDNKLNYANEDLWKSIKNWVQDVDNYDESTRLILYTTSSLDDELIDFNRISIDERLELLKKWKQKTKNKNILSHVEIIFKNESKLKKVLEKIDLVSNKIDYQDKKNTIIIDHKDYFDSFEDNNEIKISATDNFMGKIIGALKNKNNWEIDFQNFREIRNEFLRKNQPNKKVIEESDILDIEETQINKDISDDKLYIKKLKDLEFQETELLNAGKDKYKAINFSHQLLNHSTTVYKDKLKDCEKIFIDEFKRKKAKHQRKSNSNGILQSSQDLCDEAMETDVLCLYDEDKTNSFRRGFWHILADDNEKPNQIIWLIEDKS